MISLELNTALAANLTFHPEYDFGLSNHFSMGTVGLQILSEETILPADHIASFAKEYLKKMEPLRLGPSLLNFKKLDAQEQLLFRGQSDTFDTWYIYFQEILTKDNYEVVTKQWLKNLGEGLSAALGHSFLRVYFALRAKPYVEEKIFLQELAMALAYFACRYLVLRRPGVTASSQMALTDSLRAVPVVPESAQEKMKDAYLRTSRMMVCSWEISFQHFVAGIDSHYDLLNVLEQLSLLSIIAPDFGLLHALTVGQAMIDLKELLPDLEEGSLRLGYIDFVIAILMGDQRVWEETLSKSTPDRQEILNLVPHAKDVHSIKALYTLLDLHRRTGKPIFLQAAKKYYLEYR